MKRLNVVSEIADVIAATYCGDEAMQSAHAILSRLENGQAASVAGEATAYDPVAGRLADDGWRERGRNRREVKSLSLHPTNER